MYEKNTRRRIQIPRKMQPRHTISHHTVVSSYLPPPPKGESPRIIERGGWAFCPPLHCNVCSRVLEKESPQGKGMVAMPFSIFNSPQFSILNFPFDPVYLGGLSNVQCPMSNLARAEHTKRRSCLTPPFLWSRPLGSLVPISQDVLCG